jgi:hypothetical protein
MQKKNYTNSPREVAETKLINVRELIETKPSFYELDEKGNEKKIHHLPRKSLEFNGANHGYLCDAAKYICTHHAEALDLESDEIYIKAKIYRSKLLEYTVGPYIKTQGKKFIDEVTRTNKRECYIPNGKGGFYIMPPFIVIGETESQNELSIKEQQRFNNIGHLTPVIYHLYIAKAIFLKYVKGKEYQYYQHPVNLYAKMYHITSKICEVIKNPKILEDQEDYYSEINYKELLNSPTFVDGYLKVIDYLYIKGAGSKDNLIINHYDMLKTCCPSLIRTDQQGKSRIRDHKIYNGFKRATPIIINQLDGLDYKIIPPIKKYPDENKPEYYIYKFEHNPKRISKAKINM